jgi:formamidopyrimidine-DNA glycosylase
MPELPDVTVYVEALQRRIVGEKISGIRLYSAFLLRTVDPPITEAHGKAVQEIRRMGKRIVLVLDGHLFLVLHLMIAGRLHWKAPAAAVPGKMGLAAFDFPRGTLVLTEAGTKQRAALHLMRGEEALSRFNTGGLEPLDADLPAFETALRRENHTLKRALTDPRLFSGIGNAYSDEILHRARLSPAKLTSRMTEDDVQRLFLATRSVLHEWIDRMRTETAEGFPKNVTAFRTGMAVHGRYRRPCPVCGSPIQRIVYAENESNYCAACQTEGKLLADRALSRLLGSDWPKRMEELEQLRSGRSSV